MTPYSFRLSPSSVDNNNFFLNIFFFFLSSFLPWKICLEIHVFADGCHVPDFAIFYCFGKVKERVVIYC